MDRLQQLRRRRLAFAFEIVTCPPIIPPTVPDAVASSAIRRNLERAVAWHLRQNLERRASTARRPPGSPWRRRKLCGSWTPAAEIVVIERREIVVDQRIGVNQLQRAGARLDAWDSVPDGLAPPPCRGRAGCVCRPRTGCSACALWMDSGRVIRRGTSGPSACVDYAVCWSVGQSHTGEISCFLGTERLRLSLVALTDQHFDARFGFFQLLAAGFLG